MTESIGAHIDDCDIRFGRTVVKYVERGHEVIFVSLTNGESGHHEIGGVELTRQRRTEAAAAADVAGVDYVTFDIYEGELRPTIENRDKGIELVCEHELNLVLSHRPNNYHSDHRYTADLVQDAVYIVTVPNVRPETPNFDYNPAICYL